MGFYKNIFYKNPRHGAPGPIITSKPRSLKLVYRSLVVRYEFVLGSFEVRFQFGMSSLNDHIRRISSTYNTVCDRMSNISIR